MNPRQFHPIEKKKRHFVFSALIRCVILRSILLETVIQIQPARASANDNPEIEREDFSAALSLMKTRWRENIVGNFETVPELLINENVMHYIAQLSQKASSLLKSLTDYLWPSYPLQGTESAYLTKQFQNYLTIAMAYATKGTNLYKDKNVLLIIKRGLVTLTQPGRYDGKKYHENWWDWQIGIPQSFLPTIIIIADELSVEERTQYSKIISAYIPNAYKQMRGRNLSDGRSDIEFLINYNTTGTNRADIALSVIGVGILLECSETIQSAVDSVPSVLDAVRQGDGFYEDGSYIYHKNVPQTGSYGSELILSVSKIYEMTLNTKWQLDELLKNFESLTINSFLPLLINGDLMPMVKGRALSRPTQQGSMIPFNILRVAVLAQNETNRITLQQAAKFWIKKNFQFYVENMRELKDLILTLKVLDNSKIDVNTKPYIGSVVFGAMDRAVLSNINYTAGISMCSSRISCFEAGNKENKRGWHISDGMLYLYNADQQFSGAYWPTVDPYRLPGTTVDTVSLEDEISQWQDMLSSEPFVGGVTDGIHAVVTMQLNKDGTKNNGKYLPMNLTAKKSWFIFEDVIIALGSDINGDTRATLETVIENRMLDENVSYQLINNNQVVVENGILNLEKHDWLLLQGPEYNRSLGYIMLQRQTVQTMIEKREGKYFDINEQNFGNMTEIYQRRYQKILIIHGSYVTDGTYAYAVVPNADKIVMTAIADRFKILENSKIMQAVYDPQQKLLAAIVWSNQGGAVKGYTLNTTGTFLVQERGVRKTIALSNPKQTSDILQLKLPFVIKSIISSSSRGIRVLAEGRIIQVDTTNSLGETFKIEVE